MLDQIDNNDLEKLADQELAKREERPYEEPEGEMTFLEHMEVLRWHLMRSVIAILVLGIVAFVSKDIVFGIIILGPSRPDFITFQWLCKLSELVNSDVLCIDELPFTLQSRKMTGQFTMHLMSSFLIGFVAAFPYVFWEIWRFIKPALYATEQKVARGTTFFVSILFFMGISFGYFVVSPLAINFLGHYSINDSIINEFDITSYVSTVTMLVLVCGLMFQMPVFAYYFSKIGLLHPLVMIQYRKHALIVILIVAAIFTPPDVLSQILIAIPLFLLYQVSISISRTVTKRNSLK